MITPPFTPVWSPAELNAALAAGQLHIADLDLALLRRYTQMFKMGIFERQPLVQTTDQFCGRR
jgi:beta-glucosidase